MWVAALALRACPAVAFVQQSVECGLGQSSIVWRHHCCHALLISPSCVLAALTMTLSSCVLPAWTVP